MPSNRRALPVRRHHLVDPLSHLPSRPPSVREPPAYTARDVQQYLALGRHITDLCDGGQVVSSWPGDDVRGSTSRRRYPAAIALLITRWDMDQAIRELEPAQRDILRLRYHGQLTMAAIAQLTDTSRTYVWHILDRLPHELAHILNRQPTRHRAGA